jgi:predicted nucleic acid-binding protein
MIVVYSSVIASLWVPNDMDELAYKVLKRDPEWIAPMLWRSEFRNVLALYLRKALLELPDVLQAMQEAEELMEPNTFNVNSVQLLQFVHRSNCSSYDCEFVALADDLGIQLVTFDKRICREFPKIAINPLEYIG